MGLRMVGVEYFLIADYYGKRVATRSRVPLIDHIHEGLTIMERRGASEVAKRAYCLHPLLQNDADLEANYLLVSRVAAPQAILLAMEYRNIANAYLSQRAVASIKESIAEIALSPLVDVQEMLIADKCQNRKDFLRYHLDSHPRSTILDQYFKNWLARLGVIEDYDKLVDGL